MSKCILVIFFSVIVLKAFSQDVDSIWISENNFQVSINEFIHDFGIIEQNKKAVCKFELVNLEMKPLVVWHVTVSCGCTAPKWTKKPVQVNEKAIVKVKFDAKEPGVFYKSVYAYTNFDSKPIKFVIKGTVAVDITTENKASQKHKNAQQPNQKE